MAKVKLPIYLRIGDGKERRVGTLKLPAHLTGHQLVIEAGDALEQVAAHLKQLPGASERWERG